MQTSKAEYSITVRVVGIRWDKILGEEVAICGSMLMYTTYRVEINDRVNE